MNQDYAIKQLEYALQALALKAEDQLKQFPDFAVATDELMLDFDQWSQVVIGNYPDFFSEEQRQILSAITDHINTYSEPEIRIEEELILSPWWTTLRTMAKEALSKFDWEPTIPPPDRNHYAKSG
jgi:hypothetical protein